jgi:hypothetical protein
MPECARCGTPESDRPCWWCRRLLCSTCWERHDNCGHEGAEIINRATKTLTIWAERDWSLRQLVASRRN